jgi:hypothetical protein
MSNRELNGQGKKDGRTTRGMNKRGQIGMDSETDAAETASTTIDLIIYFSLVLPLTFLLLYAANNYTQSYLSFSPAAEHELVSERVFSCMGVTDYYLSRSYPIINADLVSQEALASCFFSSEKGVRVILEDEGGSRLSEAMTYSKKLPTKQRVYQVTYLKDDEVKRGVLKIEIS